MKIKHNGICITDTIDIIEIMTGTTIVEGIAITPTVGTDRIMIHTGGKGQNQKVHLAGIDAIDKKLKF